MSNWRDTLEDNQSSGSDYPKIEVAFRMDVKNKDGKAYFVYWDSTNEKQIMIDRPLEGVLIGSVMQLNCFDQNYGKNGGSYYSTPFVSKNNRIALFNPANTLEAVGTCDELAIHLQKEIDKKPSLKRILYVAGTSGLIAITTVLAIDIEMMKSFSQETFLDFCIKITPELFIKDNNDFSARVNKALKIAANPPAFARIEQGVQIMDEMVKELKVEENADMFSKWKKYVQKGEGETAEEIESKNQSATDKKVEEFSQQQNSGSEQTPLPPIPNAPDEPSDDLPF